MSEAKLVECRCGLLMYAIEVEDSTDDPASWRYVCPECDGYDVGPGGEVFPR
jgi:hypothetical protein